VDHPDSQAQKRARLDRLQPMAAEVIHVPVDFVRDALGPALRQHGHDPSVPTFWIWEGVVPYLREPAIESTLRVIFELSAAGSELAVTYVTRGLFWMRGDRKLVTYAMHLIGEPVHSALDPEHMAQLLTAAGLSVTSDTGTRNWQERFARPGAQRRVVTYEHLALAVRR
jgi:methyltransferase (TIGR00027 family)